MMNCTLGELFVCLAQSGCSLRVHAHIKMFVPVKNKR